jgi:hypothetical protein
MTIRRKSRAGGAARPRIKRKPPARTAPIRAWAGTMRPSDAWNSHERMNAAVAAGGTSADRRVDGVRLGYDVIEEHMRQAAAVSLRARKPKPARTRDHRPEEIQDTIARLFRSMSELIPLIGDLVNSRAAVGLAQSLLTNPLLRTPDGIASEVTSRVVIEVSSSRPASVNIELHPAAERLALATTGLHDHTDRKPALSGIDFTPAKSRSKARLRICVPDDQPVGIYSGVLYDRSTGEPHGVLSVRLVR